MEDDVVGIATDPKAQGRYGAVVLPIEEKSMPQLTEIPGRVQRIETDCPLQHFNSLFRATIETQESTEASQCVGVRQSNSEIFFRLFSSVIGPSLELQNFRQ